MAWYYASGSGQAGPLTEPELANLVQSGAITPGTLVWTQGLADWQPLSVARPDLTGNAAVTPSVGGVAVGTASKDLAVQQLREGASVSMSSSSNVEYMKSLAEPLYRNRKWLKFAGILLIIQGVFTILSIWGILICFLPIWMGVLLNSASNKIKSAYEAGNDSDFRGALEQIGKFYRITGILTLAVIIFFVVLIIVFGLSAIGLGMASRQ